MYLASQVSQWGKNPPEMQETQVPDSGQEDPLEEGMAAHLVFLPGESYGQRRMEGYSPWGRKESDVTEANCEHMHGCISPQKFSATVT